jgi:hypothetical protein
MVTKKKPAPVAPGHVVAEAKAKKPRKLGDHPAAKMALVARARKGR